MGKLSKELYLNNYKTVSHKCSWLVFSNSVLHGEFGTSEDNFCEFCPIYKVWQLAPVTHTMSRMYWPCSRAHGALLCFSSRSFCGWSGGVERAFSLPRWGSSVSSWRKCPSTRPRRHMNTSSITCTKDKRCHNHQYSMYCTEAIVKKEPITHGSRNHNDMSPQG